MLKKILICGIFTTSLLLSDYYTSTDSQLRGDTTLKFEDSISLNLKNKQLQINSNYNLTDLYNTPLAKSFSETQLNGTEEGNPPQSYSTYNFSYMVQNHINKNYFILQIPNGKMLIKQEKSDTKEYNKLLNRDEDVKKIKFIVQASYDKTNQLLNSNKYSILTKYETHDDRLIAIELANHGVKKILKVENNAVETFIKEKSSRAIITNKFNFMNEKLYLSYVNQKDGSQKRLQIQYEMKKNKIKTVLKSPISLFDPENKTSKVEENIGILYDKRGQELYEIKKVQLINQHIDINWLNHPQKKVVIAEFMNEGNKDKKVLSKSQAQQFYGIEGVFYLVHWMYKNNINEKIFTFMNGSLPFDVTMIKQSNRYYMKKRGNTIYSFTVDKNGFISEMSYPSYDINLKLESIENDTTRQNKAYLKQYQQQHNILFIKE